MANKFPVIGRNPRVAELGGSRRASHEDINPGGQQEIASLRGAAAADSDLASANYKANSLLASATAGFGGNIQSAGQALYKEEEEKQIAAAHLLMAKSQNRWATELSSRIQNADVSTPDGPGVTGKFIEDYDKDADTWANQFTTRGATNYVVQSIAEVKGHLLTKAIDGDRAIAGARAKSAVNTELNERSSAASNDPSDDNIAFQISQFDKGIDLRRGQIDPATQIQLKTGGRRAIAMSALGRLAETSPNDTIKKLKANKWAEYVDGDERNKLIEKSEAEIKTREREVREAKMIARQDEHERQQNAASQFLNTIYDPETKPDPMMHRQIAKMGLDAGLTHSLHGILEQRIKGDGDNKPVDWTVVNQLMKDYSPGPNGEAPKRTDPNDLVQLFPQIQAPGYNFMSQFIQGRKTPEGMALNDLRSKVLDDLKRTPGLVIPLPNDPRGQDTSRYEAALTDIYRYEAQAAKSGVDRFSLWSRQIDGKDNPNFVGNIARNYALDPRGQMMAATLLMRGKSIPGRQGPAPFIPAFARPWARGMWGIQNSPGVSMAPPAAPTPRKEPGLIERAGGELMDSLGLGDVPDQVRLGVAGLSGMVDKNVNPKLLGRRK